MTQPQHFFNDQPHFNHDQRILPRMNHGNNHLQNGSFHEQQIRENSSIQFNQQGHPKTRPNSQNTQDLNNNNSWCSNKLIYTAIIILTTLIVSAIWILIYFLALKNHPCDCQVDCPVVVSSSSSSNDPLNSQQIYLPCNISQYNISDIQQQCRQLNFTSIDDLDYCQMQKQAILQQKSFCINQKNKLSNDFNFYVQLYNTCSNSKNSCQAERISCNTDLATCNSKLSVSAYNMNCTVNVVNQTDTAPSTAFCANYAFSLTSQLNLNESSCSDCNTYSKTCKFCTDKSNTTLTGKDCFGCFIKTNTTTGSCSACSECTKMSYNTICKKSRGLFDSINLDQKSCSSCSSYNNETICKLCYDKSISRNYGINCSQCSITSESYGICKKCELCLSDFVTSNCSHGNFLKLDVLYTGCQNCIGSNCEKCYDKAANGNYGIDCTNCTIIDSTLSKGYCYSCRVCLPLYTRVNCTDRYWLMEIDGDSCSECLTVAQTTTCRLCKGLANKAQKGYNCSDCVLTTQSKGYCRFCQICQSRVKSALCNIDPQPGFYYLALNQNSCSDCAYSGNNVICQICEDYINPIQKGFHCKNCQQPINGKSTCNLCQYCIPLINPTQCNNFIFQSNIYTTQVGCTQCKNNETCQICNDKGGVYKGHNCTSCTMFNSSHGFCQKCNICQPRLMNTTCRNYPDYSDLKMSTQYNSCQGCRLSGTYVTCDSCKDQQSPKNIGTNCSLCILFKDDIGGLCNSCQMCSDPIGSAVRDQDHTTVKMFADQKSCTSCHLYNGSTRCDICKDMNNRNITGYDCHYCDPVFNQTTKCSYCSAFFPVYLRVTCNITKGFFNTFVIDQNSCSDCSNVDGLKCKICTDKYSPQRKGYDCSSCSSYLNKTYCTQCSYCVPFLYNLQCYYSAVYMFTFKVKQDSCTGCGIDGDTSKCRYCEDVYTGRNGINCWNCTIFYEDKGYCQNCSLCGPNLKTVECKNSQYSSYLNLMANQTSWTSCSSSNDSINCSVCYDAFNNQRKGLKCTSCRLFNATHAYCSSCQLCLPVHVIASCDNYEYSYRYLILNEFSCVGCRTLSGETTCDKCVDKNLNGNVGNDCQDCSQQTTGKAYCTSCSTCL